MRPFLIIVNCCVLLLLISLILSIELGMDYINGSVNEFNIIWVFKMCLEVVGVVLISSLE